MRSSIRAGSRRAGLRDRAGAFCQAATATEGFAAIEAYMPRHGRPPADSAPAAALTGPVHRPGLWLSTGFTFNGWRLGDLPRRSQPGGALECLPRDRPAGETVLYAFSYTVPAAGLPGRFSPPAAVKPRGSVPTPSKSSATRHLARGLRDKARFVLGAMEPRMAALGHSWADVTATQLYTIFDIYPPLADEFLRRAAMPAGLTWHYARPPVQGLDYEVDVRGVSREMVLQPLPQGRPALPRLAARHRHVRLEEIAQAISRALLHILAPATEDGDLGIAAQRGDVDRGLARLRQGGDRPAADFPTALAGFCRASTIRPTSPCGSYTRMSGSRSARREVGGADAPRQHGL